jgi:hypothetical protein
MHRWGRRPSQEVPQSLVLGATLNCVLAGDACDPLWFPQTWRAFDLQREICPGRGDGPRDVIICKDRGHIEPARCYTLREPVLPPSEM